MKKNATKSKIEAGKSVIGTFITFPSETLVELCGCIGFDFVILDAEHGPINVQNCENLIRAADISGITPIVRVTRNAPEFISPFLDMGALGVQIPRVNSKEDVLRAIDSVKYPPQGKRGLGGTRASDYGFTDSLSRYVSKANEETMVIIQIESVEGVENLSEILTVDSIDAIFIGPLDLSQSYGHPGEVDHPFVREAVDKIIDECRKAGKTVGVYSDDAGKAGEYLDRGVKLFETWPMSFMIRAAREFLRDMREEG